MEEKQAREIAEMENVKERKEIKEKYFELLLAVESVIPGETRHETALRYIKEGKNSIDKTESKERWLING